MKKDSLRSPFENTLLTPDLPPLIRGMLNEQEQRAYDRAQVEEAPVERPAGPVSRDAAFDLTDDFSGRKRKIMWDLRTTVLHNSPHLGGLISTGTETGTKMPPEKIFRAVWLGEGWDDPQLAYNPDTNVGFNPSTHQFGVGRDDRGHRYFISAPFKDRLQGLLERTKAAALTAVESGNKKALNDANYYGDPDTYQDKEKDFGFDRAKYEINIINDTARILTTRYALSDPWTQKLYSEVSAATDQWLKQWDAAVQGVAVEAEKKGLLSSLSGRSYEHARERLEQHLPTPDDGAPSRAAKGKDKAYKEIKAAQDEYISNKPADDEGLAKLYLQKIAGTIRYGKQADASLIESIGVAKDFAMGAMTMGRMTEAAPAAIALLNRQQELWALSRKSNEIGSVLQSYEKESGNKEATAALDAIYNKEHDAKSITELADYVDKYMPCDFARKARKAFADNAIVLRDSVNKDMDYNTMQFADGFSQGYVASPPKGDPAYSQIASGGLIKMLNLKGFWSAFTAIHELGHRDTNQACNENKEGGKPVLNGRPAGYVHEVTSTLREWITLRGLAEEAAEKLKDPSLSDKDRLKYLSQQYIALRQYSYKTLGVLTAGISATGHIEVARAMMDKNGKLKPESQWPKAEDIERIHTERWKSAGFEQAPKFLDPKADGLTRAMGGWHLLQTTEYGVAALASIDLADTFVNANPSQRKALTEQYYEAVKKGNSATISDFLKISGKSMADPNQLLDGVVDRIKDSIQQSEAARDALIDFAKELDRKKAGAHPAGPGGTPRGGDFIIVDPERARVVVEPKSRRGIAFSDGAGEIAPDSGEGVDKKGGSGRRGM